MASRCCRVDDVGVHRVVPARVGGRPCLGVLGGVRGAVGKDDVDLLAGIYGGIKPIEEDGEGGRVVPSDDLGEDFAASHVECRDEGGGAEPAVCKLVPGRPSRSGRLPGVPSGSHGDGGLLVDGQHHRALGRSEGQVADADGPLPEVGGVPAGEPAPYLVRFQVQVRQDSANLGR